jgi:hypothetical protein
MVQLYFLSSPPPPSYLSSSLPLPLKLYFPLVLSRPEFVFLYVASRPQKWDTYKIIKGFLLFLFWRREKHSRCANPYKNGDYRFDGAGLRRRRRWTLPCTAWTDGRADSMQDCQIILAYKGPGFARVNTNTKTHLRPFHKKILKISEKQFF